MPNNAIVPHKPDPRRWVVCAVCTSVFAVFGIKYYCDRILFGHMSYSYSVKNRQYEHRCPFLYANNLWEKKRLPLEIPDFYWNANIRLFAKSLSVFGKVIAVTPAALLSDVGYAKHILCGSVLVQGLNKIFISSIPEKFLPKTLLFIIEGAAEGLLFTSIVSLVSRWAEPSERNFFCGIVISGISIGVATLGQTFFSLTYLHYNSWVLGEIMTGILCLLMFPLTLLFIPGSRRRHIPNPIRWLQATYRELARVQNVQFTAKNIINFISPLICITLVYVSVGDPALINVDFLVEYFQIYLLHLPSTITGRLYSVGLASVPAMLIGGFFADWVINENIYSRTVVKRAFISLGVVFSSVLVVTSTLVGCSATWYWALTVAAAYMYGFAPPAMVSTIIDLTPKHAGLLVAVTFIASDLFYFIVLAYMKIVLTDPQSFFDWQILILSYAITSVILIVPFLVWGKSEELRWNEFFRANSRPVQRNED